MAEINTYLKDIERIYDLELPWERLSGSNILVTGATGLIGSCLVEVLLRNPKRDYQVYASGRDEGRALSRFKDFAKDNSFHFIKYDVMKPFTVDTRQDFIIHAASNANPNFYVKQPVEVMKANFDGVSNLIEYGIKNGMKRFLYVSSGEVYGEGDGRTFTEDYSGYVNNTSPRSCYPSSKRASETLCVSYISEYNIDAVIARPSHVYGPYFTPNDNRVYAQFIRNVLNNEDIIMKSNGEQYRSWCYVVDCVSALLYILLKGECGEAYNIADESSNISIRDLAEMIASIGGKKVVLCSTDTSEALGYNPVKRSVFSTEKLKELGWTVNGSMYEKMNRSIFECKGVK